MWTEDCSEHHQRDEAEGAHLVRLRVNPPERLQPLKLAVLRQLVGQGDVLVGARLRWHHDAPHFLHLRVVRRGRAVQQPRHLHTPQQLIS